MEKQRRQRRSERSLAPSCDHVTLGFYPAHEAAMIRDESPDLFNRPVSAAARPVIAKRMQASSVEIPFMQRPTCTIKEACKASGMGRTKFYELIKGGELQMISVGRRRLVQVPSLLKFLRLDHHSSRD